MEASKVTTKIAIETGKKRSTKIRKKITNKTWLSAGGRARTGTKNSTGTPRKFANKIQLSASRRVVRKVVEDMADQVMCPCGKALGVSPELQGKAIKCPFCGQVLQAPGGPAEPGAGTDPAATDGTSPAARPRRGPRGPASLIPYFLFLLTLLILGYVAHEKYGFLARGEGGRLQVIGGKRYRFAGEKAAGGQATAPTRRLKALKPSTLIVDLASGLVSGLGVGSHISHLMAVHSGLVYIRKGHNLYASRAGLRIQAEGQRISRLTVVLKAGEVDGEQLAAYSGKIIPSLAHATTQSQAIRALGEPTSKGQNSLSYVTARRDIVRLDFSQNGKLDSVSLEEGRGQTALTSQGQGTPARYPESLEPYELPEWKGDANFDLSRGICVGIPLGADLSAIVGLPDAMKSDVQGGKATYPPTGLVVWFEDQKIDQFAVFVRPEYGQHELQPYRGRFSHGIRPDMSIEELRQKLGPENGHGLNFRIPVLHYFMRDRFIQFGFTPDGKKLVYVGMGQISESDADVAPEKAERSVRTVRHRSVVWRKQNLLAYAETGALFETICETGNYYGVKCFVGEQETYGWLAKTEARDTSEPSVWVEVKSSVQYASGKGSGKIYDAAFLADGKHLAAVGSFTQADKADQERASNVVFIYEIGRTVPIRSFTTGARMTELKPLPKGGRFLTIHSDESTYSYAIFAPTRDRPVLSHSHVHEIGSKCRTLRLTEDGSTLLTAWQNFAELTEVTSARSLWQLKSPEAILDAATSSRGTHVWTLHDARIQDWQTRTEERRPVEIAGRRFLYKVPKAPIALAMARSRQSGNDAVTGCEFPSGERLWVSNDFFIIPPRLGGASRDGAYLAAASTRHGLAAAIVDPRTGQVERTVDLRTDFTRHFSRSDLWGLKLSPDADRLLAFFKSGQLLTVDLDAGTPSFYRGFLPEPAPAACTSAGDAFVLAEDDIEIYMDGGKKPSRRLKHPASVTAVEISEDKKYVAAGDVLGRVHVWATDTGELVSIIEEKPPIPPIAKIRFVLGNTAVLYAAQNHPALLLTELAPPHRKFPLGHSDRVGAFEISKAGSLCVSLCLGSPTRFYLWNLQNRTRLRGINSQQASNYGGIVFNPDENLALVNLDGALSEWHFETRRGRGLKNVRFGDSYVSGPGMLSPAGTHFLSFEEEGSRIWDLESKKGIGFDSAITPDLNWRFSVGGESLIRAADGRATVLKLQRVSGKEEAAPE